MLPTMDSSPAAFPIASDNGKGYRRPLGRPVNRLTRWTYSKSLLGQVTNNRIESVQVIPIQVGILGTGY
jgi:hypothetical protein